MVPVALHGASSSTASNGAGGRQVAASAAMRSGAAGAERGEIFAQPRRCRAGSRSTAVTRRRRRPVARSCRPARRTDRRLRSPGRTASSRAGSAAAASCTQNAPSPIAGQLGRAGAGRIAPRPVGSASPPGGGAAPGARVRSSGASCWCASAMARANLPPGRPQPGRRVQPRPVEPLQRRRAPAATSAQHRVDQPGEGRQTAARARLTAVATAAWPALPAAAARPRRGAARAAPARRGLRRNGSSTASRVPSRRSTAAARRWAAARSRGSSAGSASRASASVRWRSSTAAMRSKRRRGWGRHGASWRDRAADAQPRLEQARPEPMLPCRPRTRHAGQPPT